MTGTAATSASEIKSTYGLDVDIIPPNTPSRRVDHDDVFFTCPDAFIKAIMNQIHDCYSKKQPVLIGTKSVAESEMLSNLLNNARIPHHVLNAKNDEEEAAIIAQAGKPGRVTISTNMAGRGVDIRPETLSTGGLFIISVGINPSERIDNQLRGRAGRQGDIGESRFFIWLNDADLTNRMTALEKVKAEIGSSKKRVNIVRQLQRKMEGELAEARYSLNRFSDIVEEQRLGLSAQRMEILKGKQYFAFLEKANPEKYQEALRTAGIDGIKRAEQQLALHFINKYWAEFLDTLEDVRKGIHFIGLRNDSLTSLISGGQSAALHEYTRIVVTQSEQMLQNIKQSIIEKMQTLPITKNGINLSEAGLHGGTTTWTYAIDESATQFNSLHAVAKNIRSKWSGENGILTNYYRRKQKKNTNDANKGKSANSHE
jgi:preprotein translocase subunit SecA